MLSIALVQGASWAVIVSLQENLHVHKAHFFFFLLFFKRNFIYLFSERGEGREKDRERNVDV